MSEAKERVIEAFQRIGTVRGAARELGTDPKSVRRYLQQAGIKKPMAAPVCDIPDGEILKGTSTLLGPNGEIKQQWVKTDAAKEAVLESVKRSIGALTKPIKGKSQRVKAPRGTRADLMACYLLGDPHAGMYSWQEETGQDWDMDLCEEITGTLVQRLIDRAPATDEAMIVSVGDTFHADNAKPLTPQSGHILDVDSRFNRVVWGTLRMFKIMIEAAKAKHKIVRVFVVPGNHDPTLGHVLAMLLHEFYANDPRVIVDVTPRVRKYLQFGKNLIGITHGDRQKRAMLPGIMAEEKAKEWGQVVHKFWWLGHIHHLVREDIGRVQMEHLRTAANQDAWHSEQGYLSIQDARCVVLHREFGEWERHTVSRLELGK